MSSNKPAVARKICLAEHIVYGPCMSYDEATKALHLANQSVMGQSFDFSISSEGQERGKWALKAMNMAVAMDFIESPEDYMIEV